MNVARQLSVDFNRILLLYLQERFLYRLARSKYKSSFVLKGGVLFYGAHQMKARPTKDIDFLAINIQNQPESFAKIIEEIIASIANDGVYFDPASLAFERIAPQAAYEDIRCKITAQLDTAKQNLQLDIGFGDVVLPRPAQFEYPVLLESERIVLSAYSWDSVVAEKFEVCVKLSDLNSRMKDFYDLSFLLSNQDFIGNELRGAIAATFQNRRTDLADAAYIFSEAFYNLPDKQKQWLAFLHNIPDQPQIKFSGVVLEIKGFISPLVASILAESDFKRRWNSRARQWFE